MGQQRRHELDAGRLSAIVAALAHHAPTCDEARKCIDYLIRNRKRMRYPAFRARGLCVATGVVEAGCKHAVGARLKRAGSAPPYIYSPDDLHSLFAAVEPCRRRAVQLDAPTFRALLLLLYGAGLRVGEALGLAQEDVDLPGALLTVRGTKFYQTRLVPVGPDLARALESYATTRAAFPSPAEGVATFLARLRRDSAQDENRPQGLRRLAPPRRRAQRGGSSLPTAFA